MEELMENKISKYKRLLTNFVELVEHNSNGTTDYLEMLAKDLLEDIDNNKSIDDLYDRLRHDSIDFRTIQNYHQMPYISNGIDNPDTEKTFKMYDICEQIGNV